MESSGKIADRSPAVVGDIMEALVLTGIAMSFVGNSRPASGSEHHISHFWEMQFLFEGKKAVLHGRKVGVGTVASELLYRKLLKTTPDFAKARQKLADFDDLAWQKNMKRTFGKASEGVIALEARVKKNGVPACEARIGAIEQRWDSIVAMVEKSLPSEGFVAGILESLDAPTNPIQVGVNKYAIVDSIVVAKEVRDRYTILQLLWDLGLLEDMALSAAEYFAKEEAL